MVFNLRRVLELLLACALPCAKPFDYSPTLHCVQLTDDPEHPMKLITGAAFCNSLAAQPLPLVSF
jgi:hypothetical protein